MLNWLLIVFLGTSGSPAFADYLSGKEAYDNGDFQRAFELLLPFAKDGDPKSQNFIGTMYDYGEGVAEDNAEAVKWFRLVAEQGDATGQTNLGLMYENGSGVPEDKVEAAKWYRLAAEQEDATGQWYLGTMYENGSGVPENNAEAVKWYRLAAEQGNAYGQFGLGAMYEYGEGVSKDNVEAVKWYRLAAEQGHVDGQYRLGTMYDYGQGIAEDNAEAEKWYTLAGEQGNLYAEVNLVNIYHDLGLYAEAKIRVDIVIKKLLKEPTVDQNLRSFALSAKGYIQADQGDKIGCVETWKAVSKIDLEVLNDNADYADDLVNLGICQIAIRLHDEGRENLLEAKNLYLGLYGNNSFKYANVLGNIAYSYELHPEVAIGLYEKALDYLKKCCPEKKLFYALYLGNLTEDLHKLGDLHRAGELFQAALKMKQRI